MEDSGNMNVPKGSKKLMQATAKMGNLAVAEVIMQVEAMELRSTQSVVTSWCTVQAYVDSTFLGVFD